MRDNKGFIAAFLFFSACINLASSDHASNLQADFVELHTTAVPIKMGVHKQFVTAYLFLMANILQATSDPASDQLENFKKLHAKSIGVLTTEGGVPVGRSDANSTLNTNLIENAFFMDSITKFDRERIPERVVHAKGGGAFGSFEVTHDITKYCRAELFSAVGKKTPVAVRFSTVTGEIGTPDTARNPRGFAIKFYTGQGVFDLAGLNQPVFFIRDPLFFPNLIHSQKRNPVTNLVDPTMTWDFFANRPETTFMFTRLFTDMGTPDGYRHMDGFGIHTYEVYNSKDDTYYIRFHLVTQQGLKNLDAATATKLAGTDPDYANKDLYNAIAEGKHPAWILNIQVMSLDAYKNVTDLDPFDTTKEWPKSKFPLIPVGKLVLNKNPTNYFAEMEQIAFCPGNVVPGILGGRDKLFEARALSYRDTQNYRLGANFRQIPVNQPQFSVVKNYNRDGAFALNNQQDAPNYYQNSFSGPMPLDELMHIKTKVIQADNYDDYIQPSNFYKNELSEEQRQILVKNLADSIRLTPETVQKRAVEQFTKVDTDLGARLAKALTANAA